jgi:hypothetical protein
MIGFFSRFASVLLTALYRGINQEVPIKSLRQDFSHDQFVDSVDSPSISSHFSDRFEKFEGSGTSLNRLSNRFVSI